MRQAAPYSGPYDIEARLAALGTLKPGDREKIDPRVEQGISYADALIDSRLAARYRVPFCPVPDLVKHISADLASAFAMDGGFSPAKDEEPGVSQVIRARALKELDRLASGETLLPDAAPPAADASVGLVPNHSRLGQRTVMESWNMYGYGPQQVPHSRGCPPW